MATRVGAAPLRGAIAAFPGQLIAPPPRIVVFQYNPDDLTRSVEHRTAPTGNDSAIDFDTLRVTGAPKETIDVSVELDAADQLEEDDPIAVASGLGSALAALELLMYPNSIEVMERRARLALGEVQVASFEVPLALLIWGTARVVPVRVRSLSITEKMFDQNLTPIVAEVTLGLDVLSYENLPWLSVGGVASLADHMRKEVLSALNTANAADYLGLLPS